MCDSSNERLGGWRGWLNLPPPAPVEPIGEWVDLSHPLSQDVPRIATFDPPSITRVFEMPADPLTVTRLDMVVHVGTHVDSPVHFVIGAPPIDEVPLDRLIGPGLVVKIDVDVNGVIEPRDLEACRAEVRPGDILAVNTGWAQRWRTSDWSSHPSFSTDAAEWLVEKRVKLLAIDSATPDLPLHARPKEFTWPVHKILLERGVLIAEQTANLEDLAGLRAEFVFSPLPIVGSDGAPARVIARPIETRNLPPNAADLVRESHR